MELGPKEVAALGGLIALALSGWNVYLQSKLASLAALWSWKDDFLEEYGDHKLAMVEKFATKDEVAKALEKLDHSFDELRRSIDRLRDKLDDTKANG